MPELHVSPGEDLQAVLDRAEPGTLIFLEPGVYRRKLFLRTPGLTLQGAGADATVLSWDDYALKKDETGREYNTFRTWTLAVCADGVSLRDLSVVNDSGNPKLKGQEVALTVYGTDFTMENCRLSSTQDTLFLGPLPADLIQRYQELLPPPLRRDISCRQVIRNCRIDGSVDFIFGCGDAVFESCRIHSVFDGREGGFAAAPAHALSQQEGFLFRNCEFTADPQVRDGSIYLARPWRDYGLCRFVDCRYGPHIKPEGFDPWLDTGRDKTARFYESPAVPGRVDWVKPQTEA